MMNLKKIGMLGLASCALFATGCNREPATTVLSHDEAKEWVKKNYGEKVVDFVAPKSASSEWAFDGYLNGGKSVADYNFFVNHLTNFLAGNAHAEATEIDKTKVSDSLLNYDEFGWITKSPVLSTKSFTVENFAKPIRSDNFDEVLDFCAYYGVTKYNCEYIVNDINKTLNVNGTYGIYTEEYNEETKTTGYNIIHISDCSIKFNKSGCLEYIHFDMGRNTEARYNWYNKDKTSWSGTLSGIILKDSYIYFNYNY